MQKKRTGIKSFEIGLVHCKSSRKFSIDENLWNWPCVHSFKQCLLLYTFIIENNSLRWFSMFWQIIWIRMNKKCGVHRVDLQYIVGLCILCILNGIYGNVEAEQYPKPTTNKYWFCCSIFFFSTNSPLFVVILLCLCLCLCVFFYQTH